MKTARRSAPAPAPAPAPAAKARPFDLEELKAAMGTLAFRAAEDEPLAPYTTMHIGGPCPWMLFPESENALARMARFLRRRGLPWRVLGGGTNLLVADEGVAETVINVRGLADTLRVKGGRLEAGAGWRLPKLAYAAAEKNLAGFEFAVGIPGTLGGAVAMNAGAFSREMKDVVEKVRVLTAEGDFAWAARDACGFAYRASRFQTSGETVLRAVLALESGERERIVSTMRAHQEHRNATQPVATQCAGCIFRNPPGLSAGKLVDEAGLKGLREGGAVVSSLHGNYIVSEGASARDVRALIGRVKTAVKEKRGVALEEEIVSWPSA